MSDSESSADGVDLKPVYNALTKPVHISAELCEFLQVPLGTMLSRASVNNAICSYIHVFDKPFNPDTMEEDVYIERKMWGDKLNSCGRDLRDSENRWVIHPDKKLSTLLGYVEYQREVAKGNIVKKHLNRESGKVEEVKETNDQLNYGSLQRLLSKHLSAEPQNVLSSNQ